MSDATVLDDLSSDVGQAAVLGSARLRTLLYRARHFVLDREAADAVVDMVENHAELIGELHEFARAPFETMTVTLPTRASEHADRETLMLIEKHQGVAMFALVLRNTDNGRLVPIPGWYATAEDPGGASRTLVRMDANIDKSDETLMKMLGTYSIARDAIFLFLNQKRGIHISEPTPRRRSLNRGRVTTFYSRSTVSISLHAPQELKRHYSSLARTTPRRHAVRGHYFHRGGTIGCIHEWVKLEDRPDAYRCCQCERRRFWRRECERGDAGKGFVRQTWKVTA